MLEIPEKWSFYKDNKIFSLPFFYLFVTQPIDQFKIFLLNFSTPEGVWADPG